MNRKTQIVALSLIGGAIGLSLLANYWFATKVQKNDPFLDLDQLLEKQKDPPLAKAVPTQEEKPILKPVKSSPSTTLQETEMETPLSDDFPLRLGSKGPRVSRLQIWLLRNYGWTGTVTGILDEKTAAQIKRYLKTDVLDQATYQRLKLDAPVHQQKIIR